jgi:hypothetical protein
MTEKCALCNVLTWLVDFGEFVEQVLGGRRGEQQQQRHRNALTTHVTRGHAHHFAHTKIGSREASGCGAQVAAARGRRHRRCRQD